MRSVLSLLAGPRRAPCDTNTPSARSATVLTLCICALTIAVTAQSPARDQLRLPGALYPGALRLYDAGNPAAALADLESAVADSNPAPIEALVLRAHLLGAAGRHEESAELWQAVAGREASLGTLARRATVENLLAAGRLEPALAALTTLGGGGQAPADLLLRAASASRASGLSDRASSLYRRARQVAGRSALADAAGLGLAEMLEASGQLRDAFDAFSEVQLTFRSAAAYDFATAGARRVAEAIAIEPPASSHRLNEDEYETIAGRLRGIAAFRRAVSVLEEWRQAFRQTDAAERIESDIIESLYSLRANEEARARAEKFLDEHPQSVEAPSVQIVQFRLDVREGKTKDVKSRGLAIWRDPDSRFTPGDQRGAARLLAEYLVSVGDASEALPIYDDLYRQASAGGDRIDVLWRTAIAAWRAGHRSRAITDLQRLVAMNPDSETLRAATYWLGVAEQAQGSSQSARKRWTSLVARYPYSYYGVKAAERLPGVGAGGHTGSTLSFPDLALSPAARNNADFRAAELLSRAGLRSDAAVYARRLAAAYRRDEAAALLAARAAASAGDLPSAAALITAHFGVYLERPTRGTPEDLWRLAYPLAYWPEISSAAERHQVDPLLMLALARQESHFDRTARSPAGAIGLFQIMPATARRFGALAGAASPPWEDDTPLTRAADSAEIAAQLLKELLTMFDGAVAPAVAAYNAGEDRVQVWWNATRGHPEEAFMDSIPYRETRGYVRQVLANYAVYQRLAR